MTKNILLQFLFIVFVLTYTLGAIAYFNGGMEAFPVARFSMFIPGMVTILLYLFWRKKIFKGNDLGLRFTGWKYWIIAPFSISLIMFIIFGISYIISPSSFESFQQIKTSFTENAINSGGGFITNLIIIFILNIFIAPILNFPMFLGEELGWRGFLTPRLLQIYSASTAFIFSGAIWAIWHLFGILMGLNYEEHWLIGIPMMILCCIPLGVIFQYFYNKSNSVFVAMLCHGSMNWTSNTIMDFMVKEDNFDTLVLGPTGCIGIIILWITGYWFYIKFTKENLTSRVVIEKNYTEHN